MKKYQYLIAAILVVGVTAGSGVVVGKMSDRWGPPQDSLAAAKKLESFPEEFGNWKLQSTQEMSDSVVEMLQCTGYVSRVYVNKRSGERVNVAVIVGPTGPIAVHTPEVCFSSRNHTIIEDRKATEVGQSGDRFWALTFESNDVTASLIRVYYGWTSGNLWEAASRPRYSLAACPYIYKVQLATHVPAGTDLTSNDPCKNFLEDFIPVMKDYLIDSSNDQ